MEEEENDLVFMEFSVVDECGSEEEEEIDSQQDSIHVLDVEDSTKPSVNNDLFADMVVLDISTSPTKELEETDEKSRTLHKSDRSHRSKDYRSPYRERSSGEKRGSTRERSRREDEKRKDRRDRSRSKESRYRLSSDRRRRSRERDKKVQHSSSARKETQKTSTKQSSRTSGGQSSTPNEKKDAIKSRTSIPTPTAKTKLNIPAKEVNTSEKNKEIKEKSTNEKVSVNKEDTDGESEGEGITISADDNILRGMESSDLNKSDFVTLTVVDEDQKEDTKTDFIPKIETSVKSSNLDTKQFEKADAKQEVPAQSSIQKQVPKAIEGVEKTMERTIMGQALKKPVPENVAMKKVSRKDSEKPMLEKVTENPKSKEIEMVVVENIDNIEKSVPKTKASSTQRKEVNKDPDKFKVTEELFTVESVDKPKREVSIIGVDDIILQKDEKKQGAKSERENKKDSREPELVEVADIPEKGEVSIVGIEEIHNKKDAEEQDLIEVAPIFDKNEINTEEAQDTSNTKTDSKTKDSKEEKLFEVVDDKEEEMEISIIDELNVDSSKNSEITEEADDDVIEVIFSNGEDEEEIPVNSKTEFDNTFMGGYVQNDNSKTSLQSMKTDTEELAFSKVKHQIEHENNKQTKENPTCVLGKTFSSQESSEGGGKDLSISEKPELSDQDSIKEIESIGEPENVIEDGVEIIVLSDTDVEDDNNVVEIEDTVPKQNIDSKMKISEESSEKHNNVGMEVEGSSNPAEDSLIEDGTEIIIEDEMSEAEGQDDDLGEIDEDAFLAMMQSEGLALEDEEEENQDETQEEEDRKNEQGDIGKDSEHLLITVSQSSEKRNVKSSTDSQEKSTVKSPIDNISSNLAKIRKEFDSISKQSLSSKHAEENDKFARSSRERSKDRGSRSSRERSKDRGSRSSRERSKDKDLQKSKHSEKDLRQVILSKKSQNSRDLRDVIKEKKAKESEGIEAEGDKGEELPPEVDEYWADEEELVEVDSFYDDYTEKKVEVVVVQNETLIPTEKEHWGFDTVGEVMRIPMKIKNVAFEDLGSESAVFMLEGFDAFFVDLDDGQGVLYIDNSELKTMRPFIMIGRIARFLKDHPHVDVECERAISFLLEEKLKTVGIKKKNQIPKRGLLYIRGVPNHVSEEKLAKSLKAIEAIIPKNLMDKRIGFAMVIYETTEEVKKFLATLKIFDKTCISYQEMIKKQKGLSKLLQQHPEAKEALLDGDTQLQLHKRQANARKKLMELQEQIMKKNKEKIKKTKNKKLQRQREKQKEMELRKLMERAKKIMEEENIDQNFGDVTVFAENQGKGRSMEEHEKLRSPLKNSEQRLTAIPTRVVPIEGNVRDAEYNRLRREVLEELKEDISNGKFRDQKHLENTINRRIDSKRAAEARPRMWGSGVAMSQTQTSQHGVPGGEYTMNQFKEDFRKNRVPVQGVPPPDSRLPESIKIMIPVPEGSLPMHRMPGPTQLMPVTNQSGPAPVQMMPRPMAPGIPVISSQMPISNIPGGPTMTSVQQLNPLSQAPQAGVQNLQSQMPIIPVSGYLQSNIAMPVSSTVTQQVPILPGALRVCPTVPGSVPARVALQPQGQLQRPPTGIPVSITAPGVPMVQTKPGLIGYPGSIPRGSVPPVPYSHGAPPGHIPLSKPPGTVPRAPVPRVPVPVVAPTTPAVIQSQPIIYKPPTSETPANDSSNMRKKPDDNTLNQNSMQHGKPTNDDKRSDAQSKSKGRDNAPSIKINVGSQFSKKSMEVLNKRKNEDIDGVPMDDGVPAKKSRTEEEGPKSILKKAEPKGKIDMFESADKNPKSTPADSQYKRQGNLISVPIQKGNVQQKTQEKSTGQQEIGTKIQVLQNRIAQKLPAPAPQKSAEPPQEDLSEGNVSPQTLSYLKTHQVRQQRTSFSSSESEDESSDFIQRLKGPEGLMSLMDVDVSGAKSNSSGIQETLRKWDYLAEKQKIQREKEKLARKEAKLKKMMEKAPILMQEYEENEKKRQEKKKVHENDPLIKLLQSALEAAQQKANMKRSPSPATDHEEEDMSVSEDDEDSTTGGEFIIDYGHKSLSGQKDKPQRMTRKQRRAVRMEQKKAEVEYREKLESDKQKKSSSEKESRDELTEMLKSSLQAVQEHLSEMRNQKSQSQQEQASQNPFLQDLMSRVQSHIQAPKDGTSSSSMSAPPSSQSTTTPHNIPHKPFMQITTVTSMGTSSGVPGTSWASQMQPHQARSASISPYVPMSSNASNLPSNTFEYGHGSKGAQPASWSSFGSDLSGEVSSAIHGQTVSQPVQKVQEVFDYGHKSKAESASSKPELQKGNATATSSQANPQTDIHSLTIESISEILKVAKNLQASQAKMKDNTEKQKEMSEQQKKANQENLKRNSVGEFLKNFPPSVSDNSSQGNKNSMDKNVSGQSSSGPTGTRVQFHGSQGRNINNQRNQNLEQQGNNNLQKNMSSEQNVQKPESPPVDTFLGMVESRYERQKQREEEDRRKRMDKTSSENRGSLGGQQGGGNNTQPLQGTGRGSSLPRGPSSSSSFRTGQPHSNRSSFGPGHSNTSMNNRPGQRQHSSMQNRPGQNMQNRPGQNMQNRPGQNMQNRLSQGQTGQNRPGDNTVNRPGQNRPGQSTQNRLGQNTQNRPGQMKTQNQGYTSMSQSNVQKKSDAESITELMSANELQSWENLQRQLRQSYLEDQISGPTMSAYDQRLQQGNQQPSSQQQTSSLDWFRQSKQLQMQDKLKRQMAPKGILKGVPSTASKIWAEEDMDFHTTPQQTAKWGQGVASFDYSGRSNKGQNSNLVHYANSDSD
ncbi:uncharacterized protein LOC133190731 [Saccostrea echinata]|uniref:uncharacterized protein LOC133190731 n=1 Tax=Saccostrea echinata TaxID=191078 RepID=UPI002A83314A|nr:uncharacterized protein LOC133190731 [Saccostrea echinata]